MVFLHAKGNPDGSLSHYPSLRFLRAGKQYRVLRQGEIPLYCAQMASISTLAPMGRAATWKALRAGYDPVMCWA